MGLMDKLKNMFTEEVEIEDVKPIKKDVIQVEIPAPSKVEQVQIKKEPVQNVQTERITDSRFNIPKEEKVKTPVFFDDSEFETDTFPKRSESVSIRSTNTSYRKPVEKKEEKKKFTPTPIISPIYGVLDKNYHKEDITTKKPVQEYEKFDEYSIDSVRKKAYGTLEDDLENNMFISTDKFFEEKKEVTADMFDDMDSDTITKKYKKEETIEVTKKAPSRVERNKNIDEEIDNNIVAEEMNKTFETDETINDSDLFNLIDSMYDKGDD